MVVLVDILSFILDGFSDSQITFIDSFFAMLAIGGSSLRVVDIEYIRGFLSAVVLMFVFV